MTLVFSFPAQAYSGQYSATKAFGFNFPDSINCKAQVDVIAFVTEKTFTKINCELDYVYGQASQLVTKEVLEYMTYVGNMDEKNIHCLPGAMHHLFLDMPEEFIALIKDLISK